LIIKKSPLEKVLAKEDFVLYNMPTTVYYIEQSLFGDFITPATPKVFIPWGFFGFWRFV